MQDFVHVLRNFWLRVELFHWRVLHAFNIGIAKIIVLSFQEWRRKRFAFNPKHLLRNWHHGEINVKLLTEFQELNQKWFCWGFQRRDLPNEGVKILNSYANPVIHLANICWHCFAAISESLNMTNKALDLFSYVQDHQDTQCPAVFITCPECKRSDIPRAQVNVSPYLE